MLALIVCSLISICVGVKDFSFMGFIQGDFVDSRTALISRIPRTVSIIITGAGLSIAGLIMQTITNNKFVSPSTAGTMEWCRLGIVISILLAGGQSKGLKILLSFLVALAGTMVFMTLLQKIKFKSDFMVPLIGMMLGNVVSAVSTFFAYRYEIIQNMSSWIQGNFSLIVKGRYEILYLGIPVLIIAYFYANKFTIAGMGESFATSLGLNHKRVVMIGLVIVSFITSLIVVTVGSIPFIGLIIPNIVSMFKGDNIKGSLFEVAASGALFVMICDIIGRIVIFPYEVSISVVVSIVGSLIFLGILIKKYR